ncbi:hypothetical protein DFQ01_1731 [Paenibacillus cellulosilyticus]|uniref:Uncharacterized protein n=1 Tax=Paenibacillus cellulosilyticus TaxID=375489 RepID=A0A2V2Y7P6_9BACL|nr:hypothetical protein [Paenibacillus cellulosilyticus]PWV86608.1 hypothetical protein DFQ01_1731 [Paenibacillus cellulosilyticus]QKS44933.1 hypothetical protein HUB94_11315 [Paenibacillus cellulosilyticus]
MNWLQGGPFFELSFIIEDVEPLYQTIIRLVNSSTIKIVLHNPPEFIEEFYDGYPFDEDKPEERIVNQICLNLTVHFNRTRQSLLFVERINTNLLCFSLCFYGSEYDAPEWKQPGMRRAEHYEFYNLLRDFYNEFHFIIGGSAIEEDAKAFFDTNECWPDNSYSIEKLTAERVNNNMSTFNQVIVNNKLESISQLEIKNSYLKELYEGIEILL